MNMSFYMPVLILALHFESKQKIYTPKQKCSLALGIETRRLYLHFSRLPHPVSDHSQPDPETSTLFTMLLYHT